MNHDELIRYKQYLKQCKEQGVEPKTPHTSYGSQEYMKIILGIGVIILALTTC